jgi:hypothetical protein
VLGLFELVGVLLPPNIFAFEKRPPLENPECCIASDTVRGSHSSPTNFQDMRLAVGTELSKSPKPQNIADEKDYRKKLSRAAGRKGIE